MKTTSDQLITSTGVLQLIEEAKDAEYCRDLRESQRLLEPFWPDIDLDPDLSGLPANHRAELYRLTGFFLSFYGRSKNKPDFQLRGKDLLTRSVRLFEKLRFRDKTAEAKVILAFCYWHTGEISECDAILHEVEQSFDGDKFHPVYLQIRVNRLMAMIAKQKYDVAIEYIDELRAIAEACPDDRIAFMYYNQSGIIYRRTVSYDRSIQHLHEAIARAKKIHNYRCLAESLNNLAMTYKCTGQFEAAHSRVDEAYLIYESMGDHGWLPHVLDTKALIYLKEDRPDDALAVINSAIDIFRRGEDAAGLADSLWTRTQCLFRLDRSTEALITYGELSHVANTKMDEAAVSKYANALADELHYRIEICGESVISLHNDRTGQPCSVPDGEFFPLERTCTLLLPPDIEAYYCSERLMASIGIFTDAVIAVDPSLKAPVLGSIMAYEDEGTIYMGKVEYVTGDRIFIVRSNDNFFPGPLGHIGEIGVVVGYLPAGDIDDLTPVTLLPL